MEKSIQQNKQVYFRGVPGRAFEIISELKRLGGENPNKEYGYEPNYAYFLNKNNVIEKLSLYVFKRRDCFESYKEAFLPEKPFIQNIKDVKDLYIGASFKENGKEYRVVSSFQDEEKTFYVAKYIKMEYNLVTSYANIFYFDRDGKLRQHI